MAKSCEPQVILAGLAGLALVACVHPWTWIWAWRAAVAAMAVVAPTLAIGRAARAIASDAPGEEFDRWFRPLGR